MGFVAMLHSFGELSLDLGCHIIRFEKGVVEASRYYLINLASQCILLIDPSISLTHDLVLPIWKSIVSITLMIEKKAKRCCHL